MNMVHKNVNAIEGSLADVMYHAFGLARGNQLVPFPSLVSLTNLNAQQVRKPEPVVDGFCQRTVPLSNTLWA
jgi:hypothetical protein